jgi:outer membrane protein TolC
LKQDIQQAQFNADSNYEVYLAAIAERSTKLALDFAEKSYAAGRSTIYDVTIARNNYVNHKVLSPRQNIIICSASRFWIFMQDVN